MPAQELIRRPAVAGAGEVPLRVQGGGDTGVGDGRVSLPPPPGRMLK